MKTKSVATWVMIVSFWVLIQTPCYAILIFDDHQSHLINYAINDHVKIAGSDTLVWWLDGSSALSVEVYDYGKTILEGGAIQYDLESYNHGAITVFRGTVGDDFSAQQDSGPVVLMGGLISTNGDQNRGDGVWALNNGVVRIVGIDFALDGIDIGYGELRNITGGSASDEPLRMLTGTLWNGDALANTIHISPQARIVLIPEPPASLLFGLGGVGFLVRRSG